MTTKAISFKKQEEVKLANHAYAVVSSVRKAGGSIFLGGIRKSIGSET